MEWVIVFSAFDESIALDGHSCSFFFRALRNAEPIGHAVSNSVQQQTVLIATTQTRQVIMGRVRPLKKTLDRKPANGTDGKRMKLVVHIVADYLSHDARERERLEFNIWQRVVGRLERNGCHLSQTPPGLFGTSFSFKKETMGDAK